MKHTLQSRGINVCWYFASVGSDGTGSRHGRGAEPITASRTVMQSRTLSTGRLWVRRLSASLRSCAFIAVLAGPAVGAAATSDGSGVGLLAGVFGDHAVLQRDKPIAVWGHAASGEGISISLGQASVHAQADTSGQWRATLPPMSAGGPLVLNVKSDSGRTQAATDILMGDVFLCSGQSNMEMSVERTGDARNEIDNSTNSTIRMLTIQHASAPTPREEFAGPLQWQLAAPATVPQWSATCFYFARELQKSEPIPIGLVHSSWGGSNIRPWLSASAYRTLGDYDLTLSTLSLYAKDEPAAQRQFGEQWAAWWRAKTADRPGSEPWVAALRHGVGQAAPPGLGDWRFWGAGELRGACRADLVSRRTSTSRPVRPVRSSRALCVSTWDPSTRSTRPGSTAMSWATRSATVPSGPTLFPRAHSILATTFSW